MSDRRALYILSYIGPTTLRAYAEIVWLWLGREQECGVTLAESSRIELYAEPDDMGGSQGTNEALVVISPGSETPEPMVVAGSCPEYGRAIRLAVCRGKMALASTASQYAAGH